MAAVRADPNAVILDVREVRAWRVCRERVSVCTCVREREFGFVCVHVWHCHTGGHEGSPSTMGYGGQEGPPQLAPNTLSCHVQPSEVEKGAVQGALNVPLPKLRSKLAAGGLDK